MPDGEVLRQRIKRPVQIIALIFTIYQLAVAAGIISMHMLVHRSVHMTFILTLMFLTIPAREGKKEHPAFFFLDVGLVLAGIVVNVYVAALNQFYPEAVRDLAGLAEGLQMVFGVIAILLVMEAARRLIGATLPIVCLLFVLYAIYSNHFPGILASRGFTLSRVVGAMYLWTDGIYGIPLGIASNEVFMFVVFAAFFGLSGVGEMMMNVVTGVFGALRGGPAKAAVVASGFFGTISGSASANVLTVGAITIPMMKRIGYRPEFAAGVESVASTGGMFMPPVMGAAAFIMAEYLQVPYGDVALAAAIPAILYYLALYFAIDLEAAKMGLKGLPKAEIPSPLAALKKGWHLLLPLFLLLYLLIEMNYPASKAGFYSVVAILIVSSLRKETRMSLGKIFNALDSSARGAIQVSVTCSVVGLVIGSVTLTGVGVSLSSGLVALSGGNLPILLVLTMLVSIVLGLGLTPSVIYITLAILVAPSLVEMGVDKMAAHLFVLYYGILGDITPPVAISAFVAAGLAGADPVRSTWIAWRLGLTAFILPFMWVYGPSLLWQGTSFEIFTTFVTAAVGCWCLAASLQAWALRESKWWERVPLAAAALLLIIPGVWTDLIGLALLAAVLVEQQLGLVRGRSADKQGEAAKG